MNKNNRAGYASYIFTFFALIFFSALGYGLLLWRTGTSQKEDAIVVYSYSDMLSNDVMEEFCKRTGINVVVKHFGVAEEIITKLVFSKESSIDIVALPDAVVETFIKEKLLLPLDKARLPSFHQLDERLLSLHFDPENIYSLPHIWGTLGIGYNKRIIKKDPSDIEWDLVFGSKTASGYMPPARRYGVDVGRVCLCEDPWEGIFLTAIHKYGSIQNLDETKQKEIVEHLREQKKWLECYTNNLKYFLISGISNVIVTPSAYLVELQRDHAWAEFVVPQRGGILLSSNLCITRNCKKTDAAHKVIEFLISREGGMACFDEHSYNPANKTAYADLPEEVLHHPSFFPNNSLFKKLCVPHNQLPLKRVEAMWYDIKK